MCIRDRVACVAFEWLYCKLLKKTNHISDLSAVVTGIILAMNVPVGMPIGQLIIGDLVLSLIHIWQRHRDRFACSSCLVMRRMRAKSRTFQLVQHGIQIDVYKRQV